MYKDHSLSPHNRRNALRGLTVLGGVWIILSVWAMPAVAQISAFEDPTSGARADGNELMPKKDEFDGGDIGQGQTAQVVTLFRNAGGTELNIGKIDLVPSANVSAVLGSNQCSLEPLKPGVECAITVSITGQAAGKFRVGMLVNHDGKARLTNAAVAGNVGAGSTGKNLQSEIEAFPADLDFGTVTTTEPLVRSLALRNNTGTAISIQNINLAASPSSGFSMSAGNCTDLRPGQACVATVTWVPTNSGLVEGVVVIAHDGPSGAMRIGLKGTYQPKKVETASRFANAVPGEGLLVADLDKIDFGSDVDGAASISVSLVNQGDKALSLRNVKLAGSDNGLSLSTSDCKKDAILQAGEACVLTVNWQPRRIGPVIDDVQILHTGTRRVLVLPVRGSAQQPVSNTSGPLVSYGDQIPDMPKIATGKLDEKLLKTETDKMASSTSSTDTSSSPTVRNKALTAGSNSTPSLDGYRVSSASKDHAIVAGPKGRLIIKNGEPQVIAGVRWIPRIVPEGVELASGRNVVLLIFDQSLTVMQSVAPTSGSVGTYGMGMGTISNVNTLSGTAVTASPGMTGGAMGGMNNSGSGMGASGMSNGGRMNTNNRANSTSGRSNTGSRF
jgi:hypothetical protein